MPVTGAGAAVSVLLGGGYPPGERHEVIDELSEPGLYPAARGRYFLLSTQVPAAQQGWQAAESGGCRLSWNARLSRVRLDRLPR